MKNNPSNLRHILLKDARGRTQGWARLAEADGTLQVEMQREAQEAGLPLRLLLLSAGEDGAALDLGPVASDAGCTTVQCSTSLRLWDALALAEDWPSSRLVAAGWLRETAGPLWRLAEAAAQFLQLPPAQSP